MLRMIELRASTPDPHSINIPKCLKKSGRRTPLPRAQIGRVHPYQKACPLPTEIEHPQIPL